jgi:hypothetical protein
VRSEDGALVVSGIEARTVAGLAFAFGWRPVGATDDAPGADGVRFRPATP